MTSTSPGSRPTRRARRDMTCRRRTRRKSSWASAEGKPVSRGGDKVRPRYLARRRPHHATMDNPTPTGGGLRAPLGSNLCRSCTRVFPALYAARPQGTGGQGQRGGTRGGIRIDGGAAAAGEGRCAARVGSWREGPEVRRASATSRTSSSASPRRRRATAWRRRSASSWPSPGVGPVGAGGADRLVHPDAVHRLRVQLHEPRRSGLRHELRVGHTVDGPAAGLAVAAGRSSRPTSSSWPAWRRSPASTRSCSSAGRRRPTTSWAVTLVGVVWIVVMTWICVIGIELNAAHAEVAAHRRDPHARAVRRRRADQGRLHRRPHRGRPSASSGSTRSTSRASTPSSTASCSASSSTGGGTAGSR